MVSTSSPRYWAASLTFRSRLPTLAWAVIGYLGLFDLGLGRAITKFSSEELALGHEKEIPRIFWDALWILVPLGIAGGATIAIFAENICAIALRVSSGYHNETVKAVQIIGLSVPLVTVGVAVRALLEARQSFAGINVVRAGAGFLGFAAPLAVLPLACRIDATVATLAGVRVLMVLALWFLANRSFPGISRVRALHAAGIAKLLRYGGWVTVSSVISPLMVYMDRFVIGALTSVSAIAYYVTPHEMVTKLLIIPVALQSAIFPVFSGLSATARTKTYQVYERAMAVIVTIMLPAVLAVILLAPEALALWLGKDFSSHSYRVAQILAFALLFNSVAHIPAALLQSSGRPDLCAKLHLVEFPLYALLCWGVILLYGIEGAAIAWLCRVTVDLALLMYVARPWAPRWPWGKLYSAGVVCALGGGVLLAVAHIPLVYRLFYLAFTGLLSMWWAMPQLGLLRTDDVSAKGPGGLLAVLARFAKKAEA